MMIDLMIKLSMNLGSLFQSLFFLGRGCIFSADPFWQRLPILVSAVFEVVDIDIAPCDSNGQDECR